MNRIALIMLALALWVLIPALARADFVGVNPYTYVSPGGETAVIVAPGTGFLVMSLELPTSAQEFNPVSVTPETTRSVFVGFSRETNSYSKVSVAGGPNGVHSYGVRGSFTLLLGATRVAVNANRVTPFATVVSEKGRQGSILLLAGDEVILNKGGEYITFLEANGLHEKEFKNVLYPYVVGLDKRLYLRGGAYEGTQLGVQAEVDNLCMKQGSLILKESDLAALAAGNAKPAELTRKAVPLEGLLVLNITRNSIIVMDYQTMDLSIIAPAKAAEESLGKKICSLTRAKLD